MSFAVAHLRASTESKDWLPSGAGGRKCLRMPTAHITPPPTTALPFQLLNTDEAAAALGLSRRSLQEYIANRELACVRIGRSVRFHPQDLAEFVDRRRMKSHGWKGGARP
jgi:excisionase family DNA binding protein